MKFMNIKEWKNFVSNIIAGIFGGLVVAAWQLAYELLKNESICVRVFVPTGFTLLFFILLIILLRSILIKKELPSENKGRKQKK